MQSTLQSQYQRIVPAWIRPFLSFTTARTRAKMAEMDLNRFLMQERGEGLALYYVANKANGCKQFGVWRCDSRFCSRLRY